MQAVCLSRHRACTHTRPQLLQLNARRIGGIHADGAKHRLPQLASHLPVGMRMEVVPLRAGLQQGVLVLLQLRPKALVGVCALP